MIDDEARRERRLRAQRRRRTQRLALFGLVAAAVTVGAVLAMRGGAKRAPFAPPARVTIEVSTARPRPAPLSLPDPLPARTISVPILMYHRIDYLRASLPGITRRLTVDPADFAAQMRWLRGHGFHTITQLQLFDALERGARLPAKPILLTFDDGYRDVFGKAMPVLARLHMHATAYIITDRISGPDPSFLTWEQLRGLEQRGIEIGSHTAHHYELTGLSDAAALEELTVSRHTLEQHLGRPVQWFAYPAGAENAHAAALVRRAGYVLAVTTHPGSTQSARAPLELHRFEILDSTGVSGLAAILR